MTKEKNIKTKIYLFYLSYFLPKSKLSHDMLPWESCSHFLHTISFRCDHHHPYKGLCNLCLLISGAFPLPPDFLHHVFLYLHATWAEKWWKKDKNPITMKTGRKQLRGTSNSCNRKALFWANRHARYLHDQYLAKKGKQKYFGT